MVLINTIKQLLLIIFIVFIKLPFVNSEEIYENFKYNSDFKEIALVTNYNEHLNGIIEIVSINKIFGQYNSLKLYKFNDDSINIGEWLEDRLEYEVKYLGNIERILRSPDSPLNDSVFEYAKSSLPLIDETIKKASFKPMWFCEHIKKAYNKEGEYYQLYCMFPLGMFKYYMALRLQKINNINYYKLITALNNIRFRNILDIADTFQIN